MELTLVNERRRPAYAAHRLAEFAARCRAGGLAVTPQRLAIIKVLLDSSEHPRADAVCAAVRKQHPHISLATVHRTLETLCEIGEARKVTMLHDSARYDGNLTPHHHVVCIKCRRIRDIEIPELDRILAGRGELGEFTVIGSSLEIHALCERCGAQSAKRAKARIAAHGQRIKRSHN
ncbi:MAG: transcriptional repressor [Candidatus Binatus sp.]|uniref:Fur family transcriptional regulator n=1 Tax=Candidatus Binatus sp. TaxID=2811406 RepID=UPI0027199026|nr:transcriptional repressor [Candidatus Binatus sp.]MDO8432650.1 transcriptional repressor [Candidatus Binatus sp.]